MKILTLVVCTICLSINNDMIAGEVKGDETSSQTSIDIENPSVDGQPTIKSPQDN